jgi:hypothetical protein
MVRDL